MRPGAPRTARGFARPLRPLRAHWSVIMTASQALLDVRDLRRSFRRSAGTFSGGSESERFTAVDGVRLPVPAGETFAILRGSGFGKTPLRPPLCPPIAPHS